MPNYYVYNLMSLINQNIEYFQHPIKYFCVPFQAVPASHRKPQFDFILIDLLCLVSNYM